MAATSTPRRDPLHYSTCVSRVVLTELTAVKVRVMHVLNHCHLFSSTSPEFHDDAILSNRVHRRKYEQYSTVNVIV
jgi:hypothetical protein